MYKGILSTTCNQTFDGWNESSAPPQNNQTKKEAVQKERIKDRVYNPALSPELQVLFKDGLGKYLSWKA